MSNLMDSHAADISKWFAERFNYISKEIRVQCGTSSADEDEWSMFDNVDLERARIEELVSGLRDFAWMLLFHRPDSEERQRTLKWCHHWARRLEKELKEDTDDELTIDRPDMDELCSGLLAIVNKVITTQAGSERSK
jgi:hypothetical protein